MSEYEPSDFCSRHRSEVEWAVSGCAHMKGTNHES